MWLQEGLKSWCLFLWWGEVFLLTSFVCILAFGDSVAKGLPTVLGVERGLWRLEGSLRSAIPGDGLRGSS